MKTSAWRIVAALTALYSLSRISLGITYALIPKAQLPAALQDWTLLPIQFWGAMWAVAGVLGVCAAASLFCRTLVSRAALIALIAMNSGWTLAYSWSWLDGSSTDSVASSTYAGTSALIAALGVLIAVERRRRAQGEH